MTRDEKARAFFWEHFLRQKAHTGAPLPRTAYERVMAVRAVAPPEAPERVRIERDLHIVSVSLRFNARSGELLGWSCFGLGQTSAEELPAAVCLARATEAADPPADAELHATGYDTHLGFASYRAEWHHRVGAVHVDGDVIRVRVNGRTGQVFTWLRMWRVPTPEPTLR